MMKKTLWIALMAGMMMALIPLTHTSAQQSTPPSDDEVNAVARQLYCPVCENVSLDVCPTQACAQWRDLIREKLSLGWTADEIKDYFAQQYGDRVLPEPPQRGLYWLAYILPPGLILAGALGLFFAIRNMRKTHQMKASNAVQPKLHSDTGDEYMARIEAELNHRKG